MVTLMANKETLESEQIESSQLNPTGNISGLKFNDINSNGRLDPDEFGLGNFTIYLDINNNGFLDFNEPANITNNDGSYFFGNLPPNNYVIREIQQPGFIQTTPDPFITVYPGSNITGINIGNTSNISSNRGSIRGTKFNDTNTNGRLDPGELGLGDITLYLDLNQNGFFEDGEARTITDSNGEYAFSDLPSNTYIVREISPPGFIQTTPDPVLNITPGTNVSNINIGNVNSRGSIRGTKFNDTNTNGRLDPGELGLGDVTLYLDLNNNGFFEDGEARTITDGNGQYSFQDIPADTYTIREIPQPGFTQTTNDPVINVSPGSNVTGINIGNTNNRGSISGIKFNDFDADGILDPGEPGLGNFTIYLDLNNNGFRDNGEANTITNSDGTYSFQDLPPNTYTVREVQKAGFTQTTSDPIITLNSGNNITNVNIGNTTNNLNAPGRIIGVKFNDFDADGVRDVGEPGLSDFGIYLDNNNNGFREANEPLTFSDINGEFAFNNLAAGDYNIREIQKFGFTQTTADPVANIGSGLQLPPPFEGDGETEVFVEIGNTSIFPFL